MDLDPSPTSRKRRISTLATNNNGDTDSDNDNSHDDPQNDPSKRLQSSQGLPISRQTHHLNAHLILQSLALTRLRVTSNFSLYNPLTSPVLICVTREWDALYRTLCLCIMPAEQTSTDLWSQLQRTIPILTPADLDEEAADAVQTFLDEVASTSDVIVLFDAKGRSVWSSADLFASSQAQTEWDAATTLRTHLYRALRDLSPKEEYGEAMDLA